MSKKGTIRIAFQGFESNLCLDYKRAFSAVSLTVITSLEIG